MKVGLNGWKGGVGDRGENKNWKRIKERDKSSGVLSVMKDFHEPATKMDNGLLQLSNYCVKEEGTMSRYIFKIAIGDIRSS